MDLQRAARLAALYIHKIDTDTCLRGVQKEKMVSCLFQFFPVEQGVWGLIKISAAWMMRRPWLPWNRERTSQSVQPCAEVAACHCPVLPWKPAQENPEMSSHGPPLCTRQFADGRRS